MVVSTRQVAAARVLLGWSQAELADKAGVGREVVDEMEAADGAVGGHSGTGARILDALEAAGAEFTAGTGSADDGGGIGVRLRGGANLHEEGRRPEDLDATNDD